MKTFEDLFLDVVQDIYHAEKQLTKALPKMAKAATAPQLKKAFENHLTETEGHVSRLEQVFESLGKKAKAKTCAAMEGLVEEGKEMINSGAEPHVLDAGLIAAAQKVEHYEMATYGTLRTWAAEMGNETCERLLEQTLSEEKAANDTLTKLAVSAVNTSAVEAQ